jgi:hypothetical protein
MMSLTLWFIQITAANLPSKTKYKSKVAWQMQAYPHIWFCAFEGKWACTGAQLWLCVPYAGLSDSKDKQMAK